MLSAMEIVALLSIFIYVSLWEYMMIMYKMNPRLPYRDGYNLFSAIQWVVIAVALVHLFGWLYGLLALIVVIMFLQYVTHFTLGYLYSLIFKNPLIPLAMYGVMFWVNIIVTILLFITADT
jgi:hypothetical protein